MIELTCLFIKPDGVERNLVLEILSRIEKAGLMLLTGEISYDNEKKLREHYNKDDTWFEEKGAKIVKEREEKSLSIEKSAKEYGQDILEEVIRDASSGPILPVLVLGENSIEITRKIVGPTNPSVAPAGTIRGDFGISLTKNTVHCSDSRNAANREIQIWIGLKMINC